MGLSPVLTAFLGLIWASSALQLLAKRLPPKHESALRFVTYVGLWVLALNAIYSTNRIAAPITDYLAVIATFLFAVFMIWVYLPEHGISGAKKFPISFVTILRMQLIGACIVILDHVE